MSFFRAVVLEFGPDCLRSPNYEDIFGIFSSFNKLGFPGCIGHYTARDEAGNFPKMHGGVCFRVMKKKTLFEWKSFVTLIIRFGHFMQYYLVCYVN